MARNITKTKADITKNEVCFLVRSYVKLHNKLYRIRIDEEEFVKKSCRYYEQFFVVFFLNGKK